MTAPGYEPANEVERDLLAARGDPAGYLRALRTALLYLPQVAGPDGAAPRTVAWRHDGIPHLPVFTSLEAMRARTTGIAESYRAAECADLAGAWPDPMWRLAVNPGTPIGAYLPHHLLAAGVPVPPDSVEFDPAAAFEPATPFERVMYLARLAGRPERFLDALVVSPAYLPTAGPAGTAALAAPTFPWLVDARGPEPVINVFSSPRRLAAAGYAAADHVRVDFVAVAQAWPAREFWLAVNPGSAIAALYTGDQVARLSDWAMDLAARGRS